MSNQKCGKCNVEMKPSLAFVPVFGSRRFLGKKVPLGTTLYPVTSVLDDVLQCPTCGYALGHEWESMVE